MTDLTKLFCYGDHLANYETLECGEKTKLQEQFVILTEEHRFTVADFINKEIVAFLMDG